MPPDLRLSLCFTNPASMSSPCIYESHRMYEINSGELMKKGVRELMKKDVRELMKKGVRELMKKGYTATSSLLAS